MRQYIIASFLITFQATGQNLFTVSLDKYYLSKDSISVRVSEVIDGRKDKKVIGLVQLGLNNRQEFAIFEKPLLQEIHDLLNRSHLLAISNEAVIVRVSRLYISELTLALSETAKAELSLDVFIKDEGDAYFYISSIYVSEESKGIDVTAKHAENIVKAIQKALILFASREKRVNSQMGFTREDLMNPDLTFRDASSMPIVQALQYKDGFFATFDEFINNMPSVDINCKIKMSSKIKVKCDDSDKEMESGIYGFANNNQLYVLFHQQFYLLEKRNDEFYFAGPRMPGRTSSYAKGWMMAGALGGSIASHSASYNAIYKVDLSTGGIKYVTGIH